MDTILVIDFGSQLAHLIARRIRGLSVYSEIVPWNISEANLKKILSKSNVKGIILSGGPASVRSGPKPKTDLFSLHLPILGICYGYQLIAHLLGGTVCSGKKREYGFAVLHPSTSKLLKGLSKSEQVWMSHGDTVKKLPGGFRRIGRTKSIPNAAFANSKRKIYGVQFHPEVQHTLSGTKILRNFAFGICKARPNWKLGSFAKRAVSDVKRQVGSDRVLMGLSGGVDSSVAATLIHRAIGSRLHCVLVDNGLLREEEARRVKSAFRKHLSLKNFHLVDARKKFLSRLKGVADPEKKRRIIARTFIDVFEQKARSLSKKHGSFKFLGQGTIYPDRIESAGAGSSSACIKSHHNVVLPGGMKLELVEPLKELYKDEVRIVGKKIGIPSEITNRWPFPGPGLAVRCIGAVTEPKLKIIRHADRIVEDEIRLAGIYESLWQAFPVLIPVRSVGVMGDSRTYQYMMALRAVESQEAMTANFAKLEWDLLEKIGSRIVNEVSGVNRVLYDVTSKPPATIEFE